MKVEIIFEVSHATLGGTMSVDSFAPAHSAYGLRPAGRDKLLSPVGSFAASSVSLTAFTFGKSFSQFPKLLKSQTAQVLMRSANKMVRKYMR
jgi:hypothetical protein